MMDYGYVNIARSIMAHEMFQGDEFSRRDAWLWLVMKAEFRDGRKVRTPSGPVTLKRGQLSETIREIASAWGWSKGRVERTLAALENRDMIETASVSGKTVITICNYEDYQYEPEGPREAGSGTQPGQDQDTTGTPIIEEKIKNKNNNTSSETSSDTPAPKRRLRGRVEYPEEFKQLWAAYPYRPNQSKAKALEAWQRFDQERREGAVMAAADFAARCREDGTEPRFIPHLATWLNERRFDEFVSYNDDAQAAECAEQPAPETRPDRPADPPELFDDGGGMDEGPRGTFPNPGL